MLLPVLLALTTATSAPDCAALASLRIPDVRIVEDTIVQPTAAQRSLGRGALCRVRGIVGTETRFTLLLPDNWNERFMMGGAGGYAGAVENMAASSVNAGYATVGTDFGHSSPSGISAAWALGHQERIESYAHVAVHRVAVVAKQIIAAYYGSAPTKSYFFGCSNGGRAALMEAQRYPDDFDGIVAIAPVSDFGATATMFIRNIKAVFPTGDYTKPVVSLDNLALLESKVFEQCDVRDGVSDRTIDDPRACDFKLASIAACPNDVAGAQCLTRAQRGAIETIYSPLTVNGRIVYPGQPLGNEAHPSAWRGWITGGPDNVANQPPSAQAGFGVEFFRYLVYGDSTWNYTKADLAKMSTDVQRVSALLSPTNPDLSAFRKRGGKLLIAHGWSDPALVAGATINYFDAVRARDRDADNYVRLFMMPGVLHCAEGTGCDQVDWYAAIADWVERGVAPERLVARKVEASASSPATTVRSRPLCAYPRHAAYTGAGSTDEEKNFVCK